MQNYMTEAINERIEENLRESRRRYLKRLVAAGSAALAVYTTSRVPRIYAQSDGIDVGLLSVPVTFDGHISEGEYNYDTKDNEFHYFPVIDPESWAEGHLYVKYSDFVYFGIDIPVADVKRGYTLELWFDTNNTRVPEGSKAEGVYNLALDSSSSKGPTELNDHFTGTPLKELFTKGKDYDWKYFFGPSPLSQNNHPQFEIKISTKILTKYSNEIGFDASFATSKGFLAIPRDEFWGVMKFRETVIDEFSLPQLLLVGSIAALLGFTRFKK